MCRSRLCHVSLALLWLGAASVGTQAWGAAPQGSVTLERAHSHNDYEQTHPLFDALAQSFGSVEADIWYLNGQLLVSHDPFTFKGSLRDLYLEPLQKLIDQKGSVYGDGKPFYLWIDLKENSIALRRALWNLLESYPMLSVFSDTQIMERPVTIVLTGDAMAKTQFLAEHSIRRATRDSNTRLTSDPPGNYGWSWYALDWTQYFSWRGFGPLPESDRKRLGTLSAETHASGRKLRIFGAPDNEIYWQASHEAGVDLIGTNHLSGLGDYLRQADSVN